MIPIRVPADAQVHTAGDARTLPSEHPLNERWPDCPVCDEPMAGTPIVLVYVGAWPEERTSSGYMTGGAVPVHATCALGPTPAAG